MVDSLAPSLMRGNKALFKMKENRYLHDKMHKTLKVKCVLFKSADHLPIDEFDKGLYLSFIEQGMPNIMIP